MYDNPSKDSGNVNSFSRECNTILIPMLSHIYAHTYIKVQSVPKNHNIIIIIKLNLLYHYVYVLKRISVGGHSSMVSQFIRLSFWSQRTAYNPLVLFLFFSY